MTVLVTGGAGYIGSHVCKELSARGSRVVVFDNLSRGHRHAVKFGPLEVGDLRDRTRIVEVLRAHHVEAVLHFAALAYVDESVANPALYLDHNVLGSLHLLSAMLECSVRRLVFSSSCAIYGVTGGEAITEDHPRVPITPYGLTKLIVEQAIQCHAEAHGLRAVVLRYFNACGADPGGELGEEHAPETHVVPLALTAARRGTPFHVFGTRHPTPDGTCVRDYVHVSDVARAQADALGYLAAGGDTIALNLGSARGTSVRQIVRAVEAVTGRKIVVLEAPPRPGDPPCLVADSSRASKIVGWNPRFTNIEEAIETAWRWELRGSGA